MLFNFEPTFQLWPVWSPASPRITGKIVVNHPTVRDTSTPSITSSRPCPSTSTSTRSPPLHSAITRHSAVNSTSLTCVWYTSGTCCSSSRVSSSSSHTTTRSCILTRFLSPPSPPSPSRGSSPVSQLCSPCPLQYSTSPLTSALSPYSTSLFPHS